MMSYRIAVDIGGTFTDIVFETPSGHVSDKVLTTHDAPERGVIIGVEQVLRKADVQPDQVSLVIHGTTLATNAIIERRGARTALITTQGFGDVLELAFEQRYDQYDLEMVRQAPLVERPLRLEVTERIDSEGRILVPLDEGSVRALIPVLRRYDVEAVAVSFLHAYRSPEHEKRVGEILRAECPDLLISLSHEICPEIREYERTSTTVCNAYVQPLMASYLANLEQRLVDIGVRAPLLMIMSGGSLTSVETAKRFPIRLVESGPAGGAILGEAIARELECPRAIAFDMGGTTAKIILVNDYEAQRGRTMEVARTQRFIPGSGLPIRIPVIDMIEIGAGGGSIARLDALNRIAVGPESAGSDPGPASYGRGGEQATVTDSDLLLGRMDPERFAGGTIRLDTGRARQAIETDIGEALAIDVVTAAAGIAEIVDENMANATRVHVTDRGEDVESRTLIATGGAAPLHAARIAQKLGIRQIVIPKGAGVGSAHGFLVAPVAYEAVHSELIRIDRFEPSRLNAIFAKLRHEAEAVVRLVDPDGPVLEKRSFHMRYRGQGHELIVEIPVGEYSAEDATVLKDLFEEQYRKSYTRSVPQTGIEVLSVTLELSSAKDKGRRLADVPDFPPDDPSNRPMQSNGKQSVFDAELATFVSAVVVNRSEIAPFATIEGPTLIIEDQTTTYVPTQFNLTVSKRGHLVITRRSNAA